MLGLCGIFKAHISHRGPKMQAHVEQRVGPRAHAESLHLSREWVRPLGSIQAAAAGFNVNFRC